MWPMDHTKPEAGIDVPLMFLNNYIDNKGIWLFHELPFGTQQFVPLMSFFSLGQSEMPRLWPKSRTLKCLSTPSITITTIHHYTLFLGQGYRSSKRLRFSMYAFVKARNWSLRFDMVSVWKCVQLGPGPNKKLTNFLWGLYKKNIFEIWYEDFSKIKE